MANRAEKMISVLAAALVLAVLSSCASSGPTAIVDHGFTAEEIAPDTYKIQFQGDSGMSEKAVLDNLNAHAARKSLDSGALYFVIRDVRTERSSDTSTTHTDATGIRPPSTDPKTAQAEPAGARDVDTTHNDTVSFSRSWVARATITVSREKPADPSAREASKVLSEFGPG